jgi:hypothetical protein
LNRHTASLFIGSETDCCRLTATPTSPWQTFADLLDPPENLYASDPVGYVRDVMGEHLWSGQVKMLDAIMKHRKVAVKAAHSVGKTRALSRLVVAWVMTHPIDSTRVIITSDNDDNIKGGIWQEVIAAHEAAEAAGKPFPGNRHSTASGTPDRTIRRWWLKAASPLTATPLVCTGSTRSTCS